MMKRLGAAILGSALLLTAGTSCGSDAGTGAAGDSGPLHFGAIFALTGTGSIFGTQQKKGSELAVEEINKAGGINNRKIGLKVLDEASVKEQAINNMRKLVTDRKVLVVLGPTFSANGQAATPISNAAKVPNLGVSWAAPTGTTDVGPYIWRVNLTDGQNIPAAVKAAKASLGFKTAGLFFGSDDAFTKAGGETFKEAASVEGINLVGTETFAQTDQDFSSQLTKLKGKNPDVLFISATGAATATIISQARRLGLKMPVIGGNGFNSPTVPKNAGAAADGVIVAAAWNQASGSENPTNQKFIDAYNAKYGAPPDQFAAQAYTAIYVVKKAIEDGDASRQGIIAGFKKVKDLDTPLGKFSFTDNRDARQEPVILIIKGGKYTKFTG